MSKTTPDAVLKLAIAEGLVTSNDAEAAAGTLSAERLESLVATGKLTAVWVERAAERHLRANTLHLTADSSDPRPRATRPAMPSVVGRYELGPLLGAGGMAEVYRAWDPTLSRPVALKFLRDTDDEHLERFMREARTQAQVGHENICDVYETGTADGRPFIAMQCIDGLTLVDAAPKMSIEEKVRVMAEVAEAVHAAHRTGLVHRDLKPHNIMVEADPEGGWHPYVLDFGLARDQSMDTMTTIGAVMGTPPYMSPEQARGERARIDRRTDVYALGATLYDVLTGRPPFVGDSSVGTMMKVISEEATPMRLLNASIPADLETIVMKCLEKEPPQRYDSARALAEDLRRYLDGEPIQALPVSFVYRWTTRAKKHPTIALLLAAAIILVAASAAWAIRTSVRAAEQQSAAQRFGQEIERIEATARYASMLPLHDLRRERTWIRARIEKIRSAKQAMGRVASGPADYAIGRGYLALHEWRASRIALESAWNAQYRPPEVAYALGRVIGAQYEQELKEVERVANKDVRAARKRLIDEQYRDRALSFLRLSAGTGSESPAYVEGLIAFYEKHYDVALKSARAAFQQVPWLHEAKKLEGDTWLERGAQEYHDGEYDAAMASFAEADAAYGEAERIGSSDAGALLGQAERWFHTMLIAIARGDDPTSFMQRGLAAADRAAQTNDQPAESNRFRAGILVRYGEWQLSQGQSPFDALDRSVAFARKAIAADPKLGTAYSQIGSALFLKARYAITHGQDPMPLFDEAIRNHRRASELEPANPHILIGLANAIRRKGEALAEAGGNPLPLLDESIAYYDRATAADPKWANSQNDRGLAFMTRGEWEQENGRNPMPSFEEAAKSLERAVALNPNFGTAALNLGSVHLDRANFFMRNGKDPRPALELAIETYAKALRLNPKLPFAHSNSGLAATVAARYLLDRGEDPHPWVTRGTAAYGEALKLLPDHANSYASRGMLYLLGAQFTARRGGDPRPELELARASAQRADEIDPNSVSWLQYRAAVEVEAARAAVVRKQSPASALAVAESLLARANAANATDADVFFTSADLHRVRAEWQQSAQEAELGIADAQRSLAIDKEKRDARLLLDELTALKARLR
jgi:serine/threonine-protein kinase